MSDRDLEATLRTALADRYGIERPLGAGGMAIVFLARDLRHDRPVALKVLRPELAAAIGTERFLREIQIAARLHHPHILPLYDSGEADGLLFYVMPFVEGESLRDRLGRERQLPVAEAVRIAREVADALAYAHSRDVVHRDVKPANILLESGHALVADFGIARAIGAAGGERLTETGLAVGWPNYDPIDADLLCQTTLSYSSSGGDSGGPMFSWNGTSDSVTFRGIHVGIDDGAHIFSPWRSIYIEFGLELTLDVLA